MRDKKVKLAGNRVHRALASADAARLSQAIRNVVANALRFAPEESTVTVDLESNSRGWLISVSDQGPGIPESERDIIFEPFTQSSLSGTGAGGTGLGLPITRGIIELHGGRVWCEQRPLGACFRLELPKEPQSE